MRQRTLLTIAALAVASVGLGGCPLPPENDPHNLPYIVWPADSPALYRYSTNPYPSLTALPLYGPQGGGRN